MSHLLLRSNAFKWPGGEGELTFAGNKTTVLSRAQLPGSQDWGEVSVAREKSSSPLSPWNSTRT